VVIFCSLIECSIVGHVVLWSLALGEACEQHGGVYKLWHLCLPIILFECKTSSCIKDDYETFVCHGPN